MHNYFFCIIKRVLKTQGRWNVKKIVFYCFLVLLAGNIVIAEETKTQDKTGAQVKPQVLWKWGTDLEPTNVNDIVASDSFFLIPSKSGTLTCVDFESGSVKWNYSLPGQQLKKPVIENKNIILPGDKTIVCLNESGKEVWKKSFASLDKHFHVYSNNIIFTRWDVDKWNDRSIGYLSCLNAKNGKTLWEQKVDYLYSDYFVLNLVDGLLYIVPSAYSPIITCLEPATGKLVFEHRFEEGLSLHSNLAIGQGRIVYVKGNHSGTRLNKFIFVDYIDDQQRNYYQLKFECLDAKTGRVLWTKPCEFNFYSEYGGRSGEGTIIIQKGYFFVYEYVNFVHCFDLDNGDVKYSFPKDDSAPLWNQNFYYTYKDEEISNRDLETGKDLNTSKFGRTRQSRVIDNNEFVYLATVDYENKGMLRCFKKSSDNNLSYLSYIWARDFTGYLHNIFTDSRWRIVAVVTGQIYEKPENVTCFNSENGQQLWSLPISGFSSDPMITENYVFTFTGTNINCLDKRKGEPIWSYNASKIVDKPVLSNKTSIFLSSDENTVVCLDQATGTRKWLYNNKNGLSLVQLLNSDSLLVKDVVNYFNLNPETGKLNYKFTQLFTSDSNTIDEKTLCIFDARTVMFLSTKTRTFSQSIMLPPVKKILEDFANLDEKIWGYWQGKLLVSVLDYDKNRQVNLICYNAETLKELWSIPIKEPNGKKSIQVLNGKILMLNDNILSYRDIENGKSIWQKRLNTNIPDHLSMNADYVYIKDQDKAICFSTETGKTMWEYEDKKVTTQTGSYQDEMVLCSFGSMTFLKGNLPIKQPLTNKNWQQAYLVFGSIILLGLALIVANIIIRRKKQKPNNQSQGQAS